MTQVSEHNLAQYDARLDDKLEQLAVLFEHYKNLSDQEKKHAKPVIQKLSLLLDDVIGFGIEGSDAASALTDLTDTFAHLGHHAHHLAQNVSSTFHFFSAVLSVVNFIASPVRALYSWLRGKPISATDAINARWVMGGFTITLGLVALAFPAAAATIGFGAAFITLGASFVSLAQVLYQKISDKEELRKTEQRISIGEENIQYLLKEVKKLKNDLEQEDGTYFELQGPQLISSFKEEAKRLQSLMQKRSAIQSRLKNRGAIVIFDHFLFISLSSLAVVGALMGLFSPTAGLIIVSAATLVGFSYFMARITVPVIAKFITYIKSKFESPTSGSDFEPKHMSKPTLKKEFYQKQSACSLRKNLPESTTDRRDDQKRSTLVQNSIFLTPEEAYSHKQQEDNSERNLPTCGPH